MISCPSGNARLYEGRAGIMVGAFGSMAFSAPALDRRGFFAGVCANGAGGRGAAAVKLSDYLLGVA